MATNAELSSELNKLKTNVEDKFNAILNIVEKLAQPTQTISTPSSSIVSNTLTSPGPFRVTNQQQVEVAKEASAEASNYALNPAYQKIFNEYFDPQDDFTARLEGVYFTIIVPLKFSNANEAWKSFYKVDTRMKALKPDNIENDMREWCKLVQTNLKYNRNVRLKI